MRQHSSGLLVFAALSLVGCGGSSRAPVADASAVDAAPSFPWPDLGGSTPSLPVQQHRPVSVVCRALTGSGCTPGSGTIMECMTDADCTSGKLGICNNCACNYSACQSDSDCAMPNTCICYAQTNPSFNSGNSCSMEGNCRVDSDCGAKGACSPVFDNCLGQDHVVYAYFCHTAADLCNNDSDCTKINPSSYCDYAPEVGHWGCAVTSCGG